MQQNEIIINFTPTGMIPSKSMTSFVPVSSTEIIEDVLNANEIGITMAHLHARDERTGKPTYKAEAFSKIIGGIRKYASDVVLCVSTSGRTFNSFEMRSEVLELDGSCKPDMGSLTLSSLNFNNIASINEPDMIMQLARKMNTRNIKPELEVFDMGMINYAKYLIKKNILKPPYYSNIILGNISCAQADLMHAGLMINEIPENCLWSLAGIGRFQLTMNSLAIALGGGVRVGLEDNIWLDAKRTHLASNADLLNRVKRIVIANEKKIMSASKLRHLLRLNKGRGEYGIKEK